jgi:deazaflavin-dependent oxidoreductase (nitroreductase family)
MSRTAAEYNAKVIDEFRGHEGRVGGIWEGTPLLLHHTGAKSGASRVNPVGYPADESRYLSFASNGGAPRNPAWHHNLRAHPETEIEVGTDTIDVVAAEATGEAQKRLFRRGAGRFPDLAEQARKTDRDIPVILLTPFTGA